MGILLLSRDYGDNPSIVRMVTTDNLAAITTTGYLTSQLSNIVAINGGSFQWQPSDFVLIYYNTSQPYYTGGSFSFFSLSSDFSSLIQFTEPGSGTVTSVGTNNGLTGGTITTSGTIGLAPIASHTLLANTTGGAAVPIPTTLTAGSGISIINGAGNITISSNTTVNPREFTTSQTITFTTGTQFVDVYLWGTGGGSGGAAGSAGTSGASGGGSAGGFSKKTYSIASVGATAAFVAGTVGAAGAAGNNNGGNGTVSTFTPAGAGPVLTCNGGQGGQGSAASATITNANGGQQSGSATGGDINVEGSAGTGGITINGSSSFVLPGSGGAAGMMPPSFNHNFSVEANVPAFGCGAPGQGSIGSADVAGVAGGASFCYIVEYIAA